MIQNERSDDKSFILHRDKYSIRSFFDDLLIQLKLVAFETVRRKNRFVHVLTQLTDIVEMNVDPCTASTISWTKPTVHRLSI